MRGMKKRTLTIAVMAVVVPLASAGCSHEKQDKQETMKPAASAVAVAPPPTVKPDIPFEGEIDLAVYELASKTPTSITYDVRGDKVRSANLAAGKTPFVVSDLKTQKVYIVDDSSKSITTIDASAAAAPTNAKTLPLTKTGKMEKVSGRDCEDWSINDAGERIDMCVTKGVAYFNLTNVSSPGGVEPAWAAMLTKERAFPLRVIATDKTGKQEFRAEATKIESRKLDDGLFTVPSAYHVVSPSKAMKVASVP